MLHRRGETEQNDWTELTRIELHRGTVFICKYSINIKLQCQFHKKIHFSPMFAEYCVIETVNFNTGGHGDKFRSDLTSEQSTWIQQFGESEEEAFIQFCFHLAVINKVEISRHKQAMGKSFHKSCLEQTVWPTSCQWLYYHTTQPLTVKTKSSSW